MSLFKVTENDKKIYNEQIKDYLPDEIIDIHTHVWNSEKLQAQKDMPKRTVSWPSLVAPYNTIEDITEAYKLFFPGKKVTPLIFGSSCDSVDSCMMRNKYICESSAKSGYPALFFSHPLMTADFLEKELIKGHYYGCKSYLSLSPKYLPRDEVRVLDFFPPHQLEVLNRLGLMMMLHIPRESRLRDPVNIGEIALIAEKYPNIKLIIAHVGRAYCKCDIGEAFEKLKGYTEIYYDFTANTNAYVFEQLLTYISPDRVLFGSDEPIVRMRMHRIEENNTYINLIPPGLYGDPSVDPHLREVSAEEAEKITFFMYEEILAMKEATTKLGMGKDIVNKLFYENSRKLLDDVKTRVQ